MAKTKTDDVSKIESKIYSILDKLKLTADERMQLEHLVENLATLVFEARK